jgi:hypothetical protein
MPGDLIDVLFDELGKRFPRFRKGAAIAALVVLILIVGFGLFALSSLFNSGTSSLVRQSPAPGVRPAIERGGSVFESLWSADIGTIQDLALMRPDRESPLQFLALVRKTVSRFDPQGRLLSEIDMPRGTARLIADAQGRLGFFLAASSESYWSWQAMGYVAKAHHLTAIDPQGRTVWTYTLSADNSSSPFEVLLVDADGDRGVQILVDVGARIVCLDTAGREVWSMPDQFRSWTQVDSEGDDRRGVLVLRPAGQNLEVAAFDADRRLTPHALLERRSISAWHVARMADHAEPTIATFAISSTPDAAGKMPESFEVYSLTGAPIGRTTLPWPTRPIVIRPLAAIDTDGDGIRAWIATGDDGVLYLFSADARGQEAHHTGVYIRRLTVVPMSESGDWLILGTERGLQVWKRRANFVSAVD